MPDQVRIVSPGKTETSVLTEEGRVLTPPAGWILLPPGDAALTRRVKKAGPYWQVYRTRGRKRFSGGVWAPETTILKHTADLEKERLTPEYQKRRDSDKKRREQKQEEYEKSFFDQVLRFLNFHHSHARLAEHLADAVTRHAAPTGSGTVARTSRLPIEERAKASVIAWMRHHTTGYDTMSIPRVRGKRREVRRRLAVESLKLLEAYRSGERIDPEICPIRNALISIEIES